MEPDASPTVHSDTGAIERQLANLTTGPPSLEKETLPPKTTLKKKKKKIKGPYISLTAFAGDYSTVVLSVSLFHWTVGDKPAKKTKKKKSSVEDIPKNAIDFHEEPFDPNEPTKIRFRLYGIDDFCLLKLIGTGGFGSVFLSKLRGHNAYFAIKFMEKRRIEEQNDYEVGVCMEKKVMLYGNSNPFICRLFSSFQTTVRSFPQLGCPFWKRSVSLLESPLLCNGILLWRRSQISPRSGETISNWHSEVRYNLSLSL